MDDFLYKWHTRCSRKWTLVLLNADIRRASGALHSAMKVIFYCLAVNAVCTEHGI